MTRVLGVHREGTPGGAVHEAEASQSPGRTGSPGKTVVTTGEARGRGPRPPAACSVSCKGPSSSRPSHRGPPVLT